MINVIILVNFNLILTLILINILILITFNFNLILTIILYKIKQHWHVMM
jgi:hypothetical protein